MVLLIKASIFGDEGVTSIEYALIAALIALVIVGSLVPLGTTLQTTFARVGNCLATFSAADCQ